MAMEAIDGMIEVPSFVVPALAVVSGNAITAAHQYRELWDAVFEDPRTTVKKYKRHAAGEVSSKWCRTKAFKDIRKMRVIDPDVEMSMQIDLQKVPVANIASDPFAATIMGYFRSHLQTRV